MTDRAIDETPEVPEAHVRIPRYSGSARINHWIVAVSFTLLVLSGLAFFHPSLFWLTGFFGSGQTARWLHPWLGIVLFIAFFGMFVRFASQNLPEQTDIVWLSRIRYALQSGGEEFLPEVGKYNPGQKFVFWSQTALIIVLLVSGLCIWEHGMATLQATIGWRVSIETMRWAALVHATAAVATICVFIIHVYSAFWVSGTIDAMTRGTVTGGWGWRHHRRWFRTKVDEGDVERTKEGA